MRVFLCWSVALFLLPGLAQASSSQAEQGAGAIEGVVSTQNGTILLGGVLISLFDGSVEVARLMSEGDGTFRFVALHPGRYRVIAALEGFEPHTSPVVVEAGSTAKLPIDLPLGTAESIDVVAPNAGPMGPGTISGVEQVGSTQVEELAPGGGGLQSALRLLASVIEVPGGVAIKGGRPSQASVQLGPGTFVDPATGLSQVRLPDDAIETVTVLPNPYAVEYGRFSSGLVLIQTRRAGDRWRTRVNNLNPTFRTERGDPFNIRGIAAFSPRVEVGGPLINNRLFIQEAAQYRYRSNDVPSRDQDELKRSHAFSSFTRADANLSANHSMVAAVGTFPNHAESATLGTFTPPAASVDLEGSVNTVSLSERAVWNDRMFSETTGEINWYRTEVMPQGSAPMELLPETTNGNFFNHQDRTTATYQLVHTLAGTHQGTGGLHLYKAGIDLLHSRFHGTSQSRPVLVRRTDNTLSRRLDYGPPSGFSIGSTDIAVFAQDRFQPTNRWYVEFGTRIDRDGVVKQWNLTPRIGSAVLLNRSGTFTLRGGVGLFFERTPSAAGVFNGYESAVETRYATDGVTVIQPPTLYAHTTMPDLRTSRSLTWDVAFDHRFNARWSFHAGVIDRSGADELLVEPLVSDTEAELRLHSDGRSSYREAEVGVHYTAGRRVDLNVSYVRSQARQDLNSFTSFYDAVMWPIIGANDYAPAKSDAPHRLLARGRAMPTTRWAFIGILDWRSGLPWSIVDAALDFVGPRNTERFPTYVRLELGTEHRVKLFGLRPWVGVRADNALDSWLPMDVQANNSSPAFRTFYNSEYRQYRIDIRFER